MNFTFDCDGAGTKESVTVTNMVLSSVTSFLSIGGCLLIMFTYLAYKSLRTKGRAMLFHLSIADLIVVISHLVGLWNYKRYLTYPDAIPESNKDPLCVSQGAFLVFGTVASLLWSNAVGIFMLVLVVNGSSKYNKMNSVVYIASCIVCWLIPAVIVAINAGNHYFGFHTMGSADCYIINRDSNDIQIQDYRAAEVFSYEIWLYLTFVILPVLYFTLFYYTRCKLKDRRSKSEGPVLEMKLLLVPVVFVLLRVWSAILGIFAYFRSDNSAFSYRGCEGIIIPLLLLDNVGVNAQGFANAILFCIMTKPVRKRLKKSFCCKATRSKKTHTANVNELLLSTTRSLNDEDHVESTSSKDYRSLNNSI